MAEVADLHLPEDVSSSEEEIETLDSVPYWSPFFDHDPYDQDPDIDPFSPQPSDFDPSDHAQIIFGGDDDTDEGEGEEEEARVELIGSECSDSDSITDLNYFSRQDRQVNLVFNLFEHCNEETHVIEHCNGSFSNPFGDDDSSFRIIDENDEMGSNYLELGLELELNIDRGNGDGNYDDDDNSGFMMEELGGDFYVSRRGESDDSGGRGVEPFGDGLRVVGIESDSDEDEERIVGFDLHSGDDDVFDGGPDDLGLPLCWDCLRLEDQRESNEEFEWEEIDERVDEREVLSMVIDADEGRSVSTGIHSDEVGEEGEEMMRTLEWQVLLAVDNLGRNPELDADHEDYIYPAEYEMLFGQFAEHESSLRGSPPAAKSVLESIPSVVITREDVENKSAVCAVCKDDIAVEEQVKQLPCSHYYHGDCILPWLSIRNTCPVCRYELPTDDPDYERMRTQRAAGRNPSRDGQVRYEFEIFPEQ